jgi:hypothetical protein
MLALILPHVRIRIPFQIGRCDMAGKQPARGLFEQLVLQGTVNCRMCLVSQRYHQSAEQYKIAAEQKRQEGLHFAVEYKKVRDEANRARGVRFKSFSTTLVQLSLSPESNLFGRNKNLFGGNKDLFGRKQEIRLAGTGICLAGNKQSVWREIRYLFSRKQGIQSWWMALSPKASFHCKCVQWLF